jgi:hypothetical protein
MTPSDRDILERAVAAISEQAANASKVIDEAMDAGLPGDHPVTIAAQMLRLELLKSKAELERGLSEFSLTCSDCGRDVHWVSGLANAAAIRHTRNRHRMPVGRIGRSSLLESARGHGVGEAWRKEKPRR